MSFAQQAKCLPCISTNHLREPFPKLRFRRMPPDQKEDALEKESAMKAISLWRNAKIKHGEWQGIQMSPDMGPDMVCMEHACDFNPRVRQWPDNSVRASLTLLPEFDPRQSNPVPIAKSNPGSPTPPAPVEPPSPRSPTPPAPSSPAPPESLPGSHVTVPGSPVTVLSPSSPSDPGSTADEIAMAMMIQNARNDIVLAEELLVAHDQYIHTIGHHGYISKAQFQEVEH